MHPPLQRDDGQATVEHLGLIALIAVVLVGAGGMMAAASPMVRNDVRGAFGHALCVVTAEPCTVVVREACPTLRTVKTTGQGVAISWFRLGHDKVLGIERRSDGTYVMSLLEGTQVGGGAAMQRESGAGAMSAEATLMAGARAGRTYEAATPAEARALVERLRDQPLPAVQGLVGGVADLAGLVKTDPAVTSYVLAGDGAVDAMAKFGVLGLVEGGGKARFRGELGVSIAAHEEEITAYARYDARIGTFFEALSEISAPVGRTGRGGAPSTDSPGIDLRKRPAGPDGAPPTSPARPRLVVKNPLARKFEGQTVAGGTIALRFGAGPRLLGIEVVGYAGAGDEQREVRARLDPADPDVAAAFAAWRRDPMDPAAMASLGRVAADRAALDVRTFRTKLTDHQHGGQVTGGGQALGLQFGSESMVSELVAQDSRPSGGEWEQRVDCVAAAVA